MKLCRFEHAGYIRCGLYSETAVLPIDDLALASGERHLVEAVQTGQLDALLPIDSPLWYVMHQLFAGVAEIPEVWLATGLPRDEVRLLPPIARPTKLLMLAGNYAAHVLEQGDVAKERQATFPYVFMKPAFNTLVGDRSEVAIPACSPDKIDHEVELAIVIGREARNVPPSVALDYVAGYTVINDLSDRGFQLNPEREERPRDKFFDWLHGKWHDGFCPCGPCLVTADEFPDPQNLQLTLQVDGDLRQAGSTAEQVFGVAEVVATLSGWMTLFPGDIIATGTPAGVGNATGKYLQRGQTVVAEVQGIGQLTTYMV